MPLGHVISVQSSSISKETSSGQRIQAPGANIQGPRQTWDTLVFNSRAMNPELLKSRVKYLLTHYSVLCTAMPLQYFLKEDPRS